jgi:hypothetical protein
VCYRELNTDRGRQIATGGDETLTLSSDVVPAPLIGGSNIRGASGLSSKTPVQVFDHRTVAIPKDQKLSQDQVGVQLQREWQILWADSFSVPRVGHVSTPDFRSLGPSRSFSICLGQEGVPKILVCFHDKYWYHD